MSDQPSPQRLNSAELTRIQLQCFEALQIRVKEMELRKYALEVIKELLAEGGIPAESDIIELAEKLYNWMIQPNAQIEIKIIT